MAERRPRIAIVDHRIDLTNPAGSVDLALIDAIASTADITVFATRYKPDAGGSDVSFRRVRAPARPIVLLFWSFRLAVWLHIRFDELRRGRYDLIISSESNCGQSNVSYAHFCHRAYLERSGVALRRSGVRGWFRYLDHMSHALLEPRVWRRCRAVVAVSEDVAEDVRRAGCKAPVCVVENPVRLDALPARARVTRPDGRLVVVFVALGAWHRKGLDVILEAFLQPSVASRFVLEVLGGDPDLIRLYQRRVPEGADVRFRGFVSDVEKRLAGADALISASDYEPFGLAIVKAAAIGVPIVTTRVGGFTAHLSDANAFFIDDRSAEGVVSALGRLRNTDELTLEEMTLGAGRCVQHLDVAAFGDRWRAVLAGILTPMPLTPGA